MTAQRSESASDGAWFCGVPYPSAAAAVAARTAMGCVPKGLRPKQCGGHWHLRARNNRTGKHGSRSLKLPADRRVRVPVTTRNRDDGSAGQGGTPSAARWVTATGVPAR